MASKVTLVNRQKCKRKNTFKWMIKSKKERDPDNHHCKNYATHCCLSCDRCCGEKI